MEPRPDAVARPWLTHYPPNIAWDAPIDQTPVHERILAQCRRTPKANALDFLGKKTTFGELARQVEALCGALQAEFGVGRGTRVALLLPNTPFYVIAYYAVLRAGGTVVNCNPLYTLPELSHIVANSGAELMVTLDIKAVFEKAEALVANGAVKRLIVGQFPQILPGLKGLLFPLLRRKDLADTRNSPARDRIADFSSLIARRIAPTPVEIKPFTDVAVQQYTGGTTGIPKGAMLSHANIAGNLSQLETWGLRLFNAPSRVMAVLPFFHIFSMTACLNLPLAGGAEVIMLPRFEMKPFLKTLTRTGANVLLAVPTLVQALIKAGEPARTALQSLEVVVSGGAPLPDELRAAWAKQSRALLAEGYGLTEASPVVCCAALRVPSKPLSVGLPMPGTDLRLIDVDTGLPVAIGQRGEVQVRGPQVMLGYYQEPEATRAAFSDGWLRTGDIGYLDDDGYLFLVDRIKDLIISSGFNVYPRVIEEALLRHPAVEETNVIGTKDEYRGEAPIAFVKLREGFVVSELDLRKFLAESLNRIEMPREIIFKDNLPKTLIGKLSKKELRVEYEASRSRNEPART